MFSGLKERFKRGRGNLRGYRNKFFKKKEVDAGPPRDVDGDGDIDYNDYLMAQQQAMSIPPRFGGYHPPQHNGPQDMDGDGDIDYNDYLIFQNYQKQQAQMSQMQGGGIFKQFGFPGVKQRFGKLINARVPHEVDIPEGCKEEDVKVYNQDEALDTMGFFFPGMTSMVASNEVEWSPVEDEFQVNMTSHGHPGDQSVQNSQVDADGLMAEIGDSLGDLISGPPADTFVSNEMNMANVADIDRRKKENDPNYDEETEDAAFDVKGDDRVWVNSMVNGGPNNGPQELMVEASPSFIRFGNSTQFRAETSFFVGSSSKFESILQNYRDNGEQYTDEGFPPNLNSLTGFASEDYFPKYQRYDWTRAPQIFGDDLKIVSGDICSNDIIQGQLGDCYLLGSLASIAEHGDRIKRIIYSKEPNECGVYCVSLCLTGVWEDIILDDYFPTYYNQPAFNSTKSKELWVMLLEKAWAKVNKGYHNIVGGLIRETLHDLTGAPAISFFNCEGTPEDHWNNILEGERNNYIMACGSDDIGGDGTDNIDDALGLCGNHAYSLLAAYEIVDQGGYKRVLREGEPSNPNNERILKLRNPWGEGEWKGDWGDESDLWTDELKAECGMVDREDGQFCIRFSDWQKFFYDYQICYYVDGYQYSGQKYTSNSKDPTAIRFNINQRGTYYFSVNQRNKREFPKSERYTYSVLNLFVAKQDSPTSMKYVGSVSKADKEMWFKAECEPGSYIAYVMTPWKRNVNEFGFAVYGESQTSFELIDKNSIPNSFLECVMTEKARADRGSLKTYESKGHPDIAYKFESGGDSLGYFYFKNQSADTQLTCTVEFVTLTDTEILEPYTGRKPQVIVGPGEEKVLLFKMNSSSARMSFRMMASFKKEVVDLREKVKSQGHRMSRFDNYGNELPIYLYVLYHEGGLLALYENHTEDRTLVEDVKFDLQNCKIEGMASSSIKARIGPRKAALVNIVKINPDEQYLARVSSCNYHVLFSY